jgi:hypothetical protein
MISKLQITLPDGEIKTFLNEPLTVNSPDGKFKLDIPTFGPFLHHMTNYIKTGFTVAVDQNYVPQANKSGNARFCFDSILPDPTISKTQDNLSNPHETTCPDQATLNSQTANNKTKENLDWFADPDHPDWKVRAYTRSVYGIYRYLGEFAQLSESGTVSKIPERLFDGSSQNKLLAITHDHTGCWTSVLYELSRWCIPSDANTTKRVFSLLHLLFRLYTFPSNQTVTQTVRSLGQ